MIFNNEDMHPAKHANKQREGLIDISDKFNIRNYVLKETSGIPERQVFGESFIFNGFVFSICLKGKSTFRINYREYTVDANSIHTTTPGQIFKVVNRSEDFILESLFLSADYIHQLPIPKDFDFLKKINKEAVQKVSSEAMHDILELHSLIAKYHNREDSPYKELQTKAIIYALLMEMSSHYSSLSNQEIPSAVSRKEVLADDFFKLLVGNYKKERNVAYYADKLCLTPKYLSTIVKTITGYPISDWINEAVIIEAKQLLKTTDLTALQISEELNFPNPSFFGKYFKQHTGITPLQYKNS